ncbi:MAG: hypothetical protein E7434_03355 [Ruminococcaceae bacterium]|nr:hypothetical protein [Oscillospiraceae bacterium]
MSINSRCKDESPIKTVENILAILKKYGIETEENWSESGVENCYSLRVSVKNAKFGANGKGITKEFARASAYAEFMERMQSGYLTKRLIRENLLTFADEALMEKDACIASCSDWLSAMSRGLSELFNTTIPIEHIKMKALESDLDSEKTIALPYYNVNKDSFAYFPKRAIPFFYSTNGLAAGNTLVEACVQSLSEIFERHNVIRCFFGNITPPTIPEEYLQTFEKPYEIIQNLRSNGYEVILKDCSLGEPFPLVAAVAIDKKHHSYHVHMGAHPVFEIALERSLTEMFQGRNLKDFTSTVGFSSYQGGMRSCGELVKLLTAGCGKYSLSFFLNTPSYEFKPFPDRSQMSNTEMLKEFMDYYAAKGYDIYMRDISHLGFNSISIIIPGISEAFPHNVLDQFPEGRYFHKFRNASLSPDRLTQEELLEYRTYLNYLASSYGQQALKIHALTGKGIAVGQPVRAIYFGRMIYAYAEWQVNRDNAIRIANAAAMEADEVASNYLSCLCTYYEYKKAKIDENIIVEGLCAVYPSEVVDEVKQALDQNVNPFENYIIRCDMEHCDNCMSNGNCNVKESQKMAQIVQDATSAFDNKAAFERLRTMVQSM